MSLDLYPEIIHEGDLSPDAVGSDVDAICDEIHKATKVRLQVSTRLWWLFTLEAQHARIGARFNVL
jgi:hypothetical protein